MIQKPLRPTFSVKITRHLPKAEGFIFLFVITGWDFPPCMIVMKHQTVVHKFCKEPTQENLHEYYFF